MLFLFAEMFRFQFIILFFDFFGLKIEQFINSQKELLKLTHVMILLLHGHFNFGKPLCFARRVISTKQP